MATHLEVLTLASRHAHESLVAFHDEHPDRLTAPCLEDYESLANHAREASEAPLKALRGMD